MENDVLKNKMAPWQEKGRWYHATVKSDGTNWTIVNDETDAELRGSVLSNRYITLTDKTKTVIDFKIKFHNHAAGTINLQGAGNFNLRYTPTSVYLYMSLASDYVGTFDAWFFIVEF